MISIPESGKYHEVGNEDQFQYSCLDNSMDSRTWWTTVHGDTKSWT